MYDLAGSERLTFRRAFGPMGLHCDMRVQMVQRSIRLLAALPPTFVHALDFFVPAARALVLLSTGDRDKRIDLIQRMRTLSPSA